MNPLSDSFDLEGAASNGIAEQDTFSEASIDFGVTDDIAALAYHLWLERGCPDGSPEIDWYEAERRIQQGAAPVAQC